MDGNGKQFHNYLLLDERKMVFAFMLEGDFLARLKFTRFCSIQQNANRMSLEKISVKNTVMFKRRVICNFRNKYAWDLENTYLVSKLNIN